MLRSTTTLLCKAQFLGVMPRYLTSNEALQRAMERDERRKSLQTEEAPQSIGRGPRPENERLRVDARPPARGRGGFRGGGGGGNFNGGGGQSFGGRGGYDGGRGGSDGGRGRGGFNQQQKPMWPCVCGKRNYENRTTCFACQAPKPDQASNPVGGFSQQQKPMWPCACGKRNYENRTTCFACQTPKPDGVAAV